MKGSASSKEDRNRAIVAALKGSARPDELARVHDLALSRIYQIKRAAKREADRAMAQREAGVGALREVAAAEGMSVAQLVAFFARHGVLLIGAGRGLVTPKV